LIERKPRVGITIGDPAGIGPEVVVKALCTPEVGDTKRAPVVPILIGDLRVLEEASRRFVDGRLRFRKISRPEEAIDDGRAVNLIDLANVEAGPMRYGEVCAEYGQAFVAWSRLGTKLAAEGALDAIASAPINKESMHAAGEHFEGQTELIMSDLRVKNFCTIVVGGNYRVFLVSAHVSLMRAIQLAKKDRIERILRLAVDALHVFWGIARPKIGVAALNPHAGEGGLFGTEEHDEIAPAISAVSALTADVSGPEPADSLYYQANAGQFDGVVGMYHDQATIPLKQYGYVTVIAGSPVIRTTAGHGTAYNIAGRGVANGALMTRAIHLAAELASKRSAGGKPSHAD
jgi:4-phospho-D-threonate 3-dehydrogenase / 4-phospho-D-erythronate 3-dehydrogenase